MAKSSISLAQDQFSCSICLHLVQDPVVIPCGHSYCMSCITGCWDQDDQKGVYSCPQCRQTFTPRPVLCKNTMLAEVLEKLKNTKLQAAHPAQCYTGSVGVECDVCTGRKHKAIKSCLVCLNSYCQDHLEQHETLFRGKRHNLMDATGRLQEMICPQHDKLLEVYCLTDQHCICYLCAMDEHKTHKTVSAAAERAEKQRQLKETRRKFCHKIQEKQKQLEELRKAMESHKCSAQTALEDSERIFTELIRSIERRRSEVTRLIRDQEKTEVSRAEEQLKRLEQEIEDLRKRDAELEQLSHTDLHIHFLQSFQSLSVPPGSTDSPSITVSSHLSFDDVGKSVSDLREKLEHFCREEIKMISGKLTYTENFPPLEPKTREECLQNSHQFTLDKNTENKNTFLVKGNRDFGSTATQKGGKEIYNGGVESRSDETTLDDIHVKPIVSLPEVEVKSDEEDEEILFKERIKLYRWDCENELWKERGVGDIKILFHPVRKTYRVKMQQDQVLKVCANHIISKNTVPKLMTTSTDAMVWTATDYSEGIRKVEKFAAKFKTPGLAKSFRQVFTDCQSCR
uniref:FinTRIM family, member 8 n=1 Tax=Cyprinus carpio TaxID=7962 RepID=A0A8C2FRL1_CYPCA